MSTPVQGQLTGSAKNEEIKETTVQLHPRWNAVLVISNDRIRKNIRVSSDVLCLASDYFDRLLSSGFQEGQQVQNGECPEINLIGDCPDAMEIILSILHHRRTYGPIHLSPRKLAIVATCCDKYDVVEPLESTIGRWITEQPNCNKATPEEAGCLLVSLRRFGHHSELQRMVKKTIMTLRIDYDFDKWTEDTIISQLDERIIAKDLRSVVEKTIRSLADESSVTLMHRGRCGHCLQPINTRGPAKCSNANCHAGHLDNLHPMYCTPEQRTTEFITMLIKSSLWPPGNVFETYTLKAIQSHLQKLQEMNVHSCQHEKNCLLRLDLDKLHAATTAIFQRTQVDFQLHAETSTEPGVEAVAEES